MPNSSVVHIVYWQSSNLLPLAIPVKCGDLSASKATPRPSQSPKVKHTLTVAFVFPFPPLVMSDLTNVTELPLWLLKVFRSFPKLQLDFVYVLWRRLSTTPSFTWCLCFTLRSLCQSNWIMFEHIHLILGAGWKNYGRRELTGAV